MPPAIEIVGRPAAPGVATGPLVLIRGAPKARRASGDPAHEQRDLEVAVASVIAAIGRLADSVDGEARDILEFQVAMLEDGVLTDVAIEIIGRGHDAASAFAEAVGAQIADYEATADEYFRARAVDLHDLSDQVVRRLSGEAEAAPPSGAVLAGEDVTPSRFLAVDWSKGGGIALFAGSPSSHVAMLARSRGVPMVVGLGAFDAVGHASAIVDGVNGRLVLSPAADDLRDLAVARADDDRRQTGEAAAARLPAATADGVPVKVMINIAEPAELDAIDPAIADGIGLFRTEFLFSGASGLPDEESQFAAYRKIAEWAGEKPAVIRTLDAGGDKPVPGLTIPGESNPFLGTRGIRLSLARPDVFRAQLRALARAAVLGNIKAMLPMVTVPEEITAASAILDAAVNELRAAGIACRRPPLGIMVEVPAVAITPDFFAAAEFFSIGSNDLTQYVTASARDIAAVASLNDPGNPAVTRLISNVVEAGARLGRDVSLCGDMGGDPAHLTALIGAGLRSVSVAPRLVGRTKLALAAITAGRP